MPLSTTCRRLISCMLFSFMGACAVESSLELDDVTQPLTTSLSTPVTIQAENPGVLASLQVHTVTLDPGEAAYLNGLGTTTSTEVRNMLDELEIQCTRTGAAIEYIQSTQNHSGSDALDPSQWQAVRMLVVNQTTSEATHSCSLRAAVWHPPGSHTYLASSSNTRFSSTDALTGWRWGTENDADYTGYDSDEMYIYPSWPAGSAEYVLRSDRFNVTADAASFDVYSEIELTACYQGTGSCDPDWDNPNSGRLGSTVNIRLLVQQMATASSSTVCETTYVPSASTFTRVNVTYDEHHKKAHLVAYNVGFDSACTGRSFIVKTLVQWVDGSPVKVEPGTGGSSGYSTGFAFHN